MLEEKDLQAIRSIVKEEVTEAEKRIAKSTVALMDAEFSQRFNLLAENQQVMLEKLERLDDMEVMDTRITALEAMVKKLNREMEKLKKSAIKNPRLGADNTGVGNGAEHCEALPLHFTRLEGSGQWANTSGKQPA